MNKKNRYRKDANLLLEDAKNPKNKNVKLYSDGWANALTGLRTTQDKAIYNTFDRYETLDWQTLSWIWVGDGYGKKIISVVADDMTREWISIENDSENVLLNKLDMLGARKKFNLALKWKRLFGGSIIVMGIDDGRELNEPVNVNGIKSINYLRVFDRTDISITNFNFFDDPSSPDFGQLEYYTVSPSFGSVFNVHRDRVLEFKGIPVPSRLENETWWYWGMSELQPIWNEIKDFNSGRKHIDKILYEFVIGIYKLSNLAELIAEGNEDKIIKRMNAIDLSKSIVNAVLLDTTEEYQRISSTITGLPELMDRFMLFISGVADIPVTRLFGRSPAGQNATGESDLMNYYDSIVPKQDNDMQVPLQKLINYINISKEIGNKKVEEPIIKFNKLFQLTEKEEIENREKQKNIDIDYINSGVLSNEEVRESRYKNGYSFETTLMEDSELDQDTEIIMPEEMDDE